MWWNNVETKPYGGYPQHWDIKILQKLDDAHQAAGKTAEWDTSQRSEAAPYGIYNGMTITEAAAGTNDQALGYLPETKNGALLISTKTRPRLTRATTWDQHAGCQPTRAPDLVLLPAAHLQPLHLPGCAAACPRKRSISARRWHRADRPGPLPRLPQVRGAVPVQEIDVPRHHPHQREMHRLLPARGRQRPAERWRADGDALHGGLPGKIRLNGLVDITADGSWAEAPQHPLYYMIKTRRSPCRSTRSLAPSPISITSRRAGRRAPTCTKCLARRGRGDCPLHRPVARAACSHAAFPHTQKMIFRYEIEEGPLVLETEVNGQPWQMYNDTVIGLTARGAKPCA